MNRKEIMKKMKEGKEITLKRIGGLSFRLYYIEGEKIDGHIVESLLCDKEIKFLDGNEYSATRLGLSLPVEK